MIHMVAMIVFLHANVSQSWLEISKVYPSLDILRRTVWSGRYYQARHRLPRSLLWKLCLCFETFDESQWIAISKKERENYSKLLTKYGPGLSTESNEVEVQKIEADVDPLSNSWYNEAVDEDALEETIMKDVERTFPEEDFFRDAKIQKMLLNVLWVYAKLNPSLSYRQGMHELVGPLLWVVSKDASNVTIGDSKSSEALGVVFDSSYVEADTFMMFRAVMKNAKPWYQSARGDDTVPPIVSKSKSIQDDILRVADPGVYRALQAHGIEPQIWGIRWIRLIFGREFGFHRTLDLWDSLFSADGQSLKLVDYICVVMLLRARSRILEGDHTEILTLLLNYPENEENEGGAADPPFTYVSNAIFLRENLCEEAGKYISSQFNPPVRPADSTPGRSNLISRKRLDAFAAKSVSSVDKLLRDAYEEAKKKAIDIGAQTARSVGTPSRRRKLSSRQLVPQSNSTSVRSSSEIDLGGLTQLLGQSLAVLENPGTERESSTFKSALSDIRHVYESLSDFSIGDDFYHAEIGPESLESKLSAHSINSDHANESEPVADRMPKSALLTEKKSVDPIFKSPTRATLAQSEFAWMLSSDEPQPKVNGFLRNDKKDNASSKIDLFELS